jgi:UMF1 family MFS transporter
MIPLGRSTEFFGFYSISSKFAGIAGPLVFAVAGQSMGTSRWGILSLTLFFVVGAVLLRRVDVTAGQERARQAEGRMRLKRAATAS